MFCSECGAKVDGKFCWSCGRQLAERPVHDRPLAATDWRKLTSYDALIQIPAVRQRIAGHAARSRKTISGEQFLEICDKFVLPFAGVVSLTAIAALAQPLGEKLGLKTGKTHSARFAEPPGAIIVAILCSLAQNGQELRGVGHHESGCIIEAALPSDIWSLGGQLTVAVGAVRDTTVVDAAVTIPGQLYDWGKSKRSLDRLFDDVTALARAA